MWKYITSPPQCMNAHIGMTVHSNLTGRICHIVNISYSSAVRFTCCKYSPQIWIETDDTRGHSAPVYYIEFKCTICKYWQCKEWYLLKEYDIGEG